MSSQLRKTHPNICMEISRRHLSAHVKYPEKGKFTPVRGVNCPIHREKPLYENDEIEDF